MRTLPDPRWDSRRPVPAVLWGDGTPGVSIPPGPSTTQTHSQQPLRVVVDGMCPSTEWQRTTPRLRESSGGAQPARRKTVSLGLLGAQTLKFYHNPPGRTIPNRVPERTEGRGRLQFHRAVVRFFLPEHTESGFAGHRRRLGKDVVPTLQPQPCHRGGTRSVASARLPTYPFLTQKWYRPGARCTRAALGAGR